MRALLCKNTMLVISEMMGYFSNPSDFICQSSWILPINILLHGRVFNIKFHLRRTASQTCRQRTRNLEVRVHERELGKRGNISWIRDVIVYFMNGKPRAFSNISKEQARLESIFLFRHVVVWNTVKQIDKMAFQIGSVCNVYFHGRQAVQKDTKLTRIRLKRVNPLQGTPSRLKMDSLVRFTGTVDPGTATSGRPPTLWASQVKIF